ncbi:acyltransferase [Heyndrickxia ginsengihumi]|uniref:acyltransferase n=1 Tax=Heyndrickxia ginsengihumi TaxID=363870 RepID=UPI003D2334AF
MPSMYKLVRGFQSLLHIILLKIKFGNKFTVSLKQDISRSTCIEVRENSKIIIDGLIHTKKNVELKSFNGGVLKIAPRCTFNNNCMIASGKSITIETGTIFGPNVVVVDHDHDFRTVNNILEAKYICKDIYIGKNVWIGANVVILKGTTIGDNSVIGAGCIISGNIEENSVIIQKKELKIGKIKKEKQNDSIINSYSVLE